MPEYLDQKRWIPMLDMGQEMNHGRKLDRSTGSALDVYSIVTW